VALDYLPSCFTVEPVPGLGAVVAAQVKRITVRRQRSASLALAGPHCEIFDMAKRALDFSHLSVEERLKLIEDLWDSVADDPDAVPLTEAQAEELDRRLEAYEKDGDPGRPWREVLDELERLRK